MDLLIQEAPDLETGESCLDFETGERKVNAGHPRKYLKKCESNYTKVTISTNDETGEPEWVYEYRFNTKDLSNTRKFHISKTILHSKFQIYNGQNDSYFNMIDTNLHTQYKEKIYEEGNIMRSMLYCSPILLFLLMVCFYPALAALLSLLIEIFKHAWFHRREGKVPPEKRHVYRLSRSPVHKVLSEFCAVCQADRMVYMVGKIQDAKLRMKGRAQGTGVGGCGMPGTQVLTTG